MKNNLPNNIKFSYLFRNTGNYKSFGFVVLSNPGGRNPQEIDADLRRLLIDGAYFYPEQLQLPVLDDGEEGMWHEYENVEIAKENLTDARTVEELIALLVGALVARPPALSIRI